MVITSTSLYSLSTPRTYVVCILNLSRGLLKLDQNIVYVYALELIVIVMKCIKLCSFARKSRLIFFFIFSHPHLHPLLDYSV